MKKLIFILLMSFFAINTYSQKTQYKVNMDSVIVESYAEFFIYNGPYGEMLNVKEPAIKFYLTVKNKGKNPIPNLCATNRSKYVNLYINDTINNSLSLYNGTEIKGNSLITKNNSDTYTWWIFENEAYADVFTVKWQYMEKYSNKIKVNVKTKTLEFVN